jgi:hypothetical protein
MPEHDKSTTIAGRVTHVFAHRFVVQTETSAVLADLGPKGAEAVSLREGDRIVVVGEMKPSELKVWRVTGPDGRTVDSDGRQAPPAPPSRSEASPEIVTRALAAAGLELAGGPLRRPKHFEVLGRGADGALVEAHVEFDGRIRKTRPGDLADLKWSEKRNEDNL